LFIIQTEIIEKMNQTPVNLRIFPLIFLIFWQDTCLLSNALTTVPSYGTKSFRNIRNTHQIQNGVASRKGLTMVLEKSSQTTGEDDSILDPATESLLKQIPPEASAVINKKIELMMDGKKEDPVSEEEFEALMQTVPEEVRNSLRMVGIGSRRRGPMTEPELVAKLPEDLRPMVAGLSPVKKEKLLNMNVDISKQLRKKEQQGEKFNTDEEIRRMVKELYDSVFEVDSDVTSAEDIKTALIEDYTSAIDNVQILNDRMKKEAKNYKKALEEYQDLKEELQQELESDPMYQLRLFGEKSFPQKAALVGAIMISNNTVYQIIKFFDGRDGNILLAATQVLGIFCLLYFYGLFGNLQIGGNSDSEMK